MAYVYADMDALVKYQQEIVHTLPELEQQNGCKKELIASTKSAIHAAIERAVAAEWKAYADLQVSEEKLYEAERQTSEMNSHLGEGQDPISTPEFYYEDVEEKQRWYSYAVDARTHAENTLVNFEAYVRRYEQEQADGIEQIKEYLGKSGKFFESYIQKLIEVKNCTALSGEDSAKASGSGNGSAAAATTAAASGGQRLSVREAGEQWTKSLSEEQCAAIKSYTASSYQNINATLRGLSPSFKPGNREKAVHIHQALSTSSIPQACTVYRGASEAALGALQNLPDEQLVGSYLSDSGFMSTSILKETAFKGDVSLIIDVPAGAKGAYVGYLSLFGHGENEVLFDMGTVIQITSVKRDSYGRRIVRAKMMV